MTNLEEAIKLSNLGWHIFPIWGVEVRHEKTVCLCGKNHEKSERDCGKHPISKHGYLDATTDQDKIKKWWTEHPKANIGVATGAISGICVLDKDPRNGGNQSIIKYGDVPTTVEAVSGGGGGHYFFLYSKDVKSGNGVLGDGLDVKSDGGYIIVYPSLHKDGGMYEWITNQSPFEIKMAQPPEWMKGLIKPKYYKKEVYEDGERNVALASVAGRMRVSGLNEEEIYHSLLEINKKRCIPPLPESAVKTVAQSISKYPVERKKNIAKLAKTMEIMETDDNLKSLFRFNLFTKDIEYANKPIFSELATTGMILSDNDFIEIKYYLSKTQGFEPEIKTIIEACVLMSRQNTHHPIRDYINNLKWDGTHRLDSWLIDYCGCEDNCYTRAVGRKVLTAAVARVFSPGCKFDFMMILEGEQGIGKSQLVGALGGGWYLDTDIMERTKDTVDKMRGAWIIEISELVGFKKKDVESLKAFVSRQVDRERLSYRREPADFPRQCIFIGTHNPSGDNTYFYDDTGNRRFWPISCKKTDYVGIREARNQLFAEAKIYYDQGEQLYLDREDERIQADNAQKERTAEDPWMFSIKEHLTPNVTKITGKTILLDILKIPPERHFKESLMKVGRVMKELGWEKKRDGNGNREWFYEKVQEQKPIIPKEPIKESQLDMDMRGINDD